MAITFPLELPSDPSPSNITFSFNTVVGLAQSIFTFQQHVQVYTGTIWKAVFEIPPLTPKQASKWLSFLMSLNGQEGTFYLRPIRKNLAKQVYGGVVKGNSQISKSLLTTGWRPNTLIVNGGDFVSVENNLLMAVTDIYSDGRGNATIESATTLRSPLNNSLVETINPQGLFRLSKNQTDFSVSLGEQYTVSVDCMEAI